MLTAIRLCSEKKRKMLNVQKQFLNKFMSNILACLFLIIAATSSNSDEFSEVEKAAKENQFDGRPILGLPQSARAYIKK